MHRERLRQLTTSEEPDPTAFASLATESGAEAIIDLIVVGRGDVPLVVTGSEFWPEIIVGAGGDEATVSDCLLVEQRGEAQADADSTVVTQMWSGTLMISDGKWLVDEISPGETDCLPADLNTQLLDAYFAWDSAKNSWWDPPDPDHPLIEEVMIGGGRETMRDQLTQHRDDGIVIRDTHDPRTNAVVDRLGIGTAWITDCYPADEGGLQAFDSATGELREDLTPPPESGQLDRMVVNLERTEQGVWKVAGWRSGRDATCEPGETPYAVG